MLLRHFFALSDAELITKDKKVLDEDKWREFEHAIQQRCAGTPVAYITSYREFWSMELLVTPDVLVPRPETELLVELVLEKINPDAKALVADLGTGSGAIALAIASERPRARIIATDNITSSAYRRTKKCATLERQ